MSLVFLLLLTIIGITAMSTTSLEEKMAHNVKDKTLSMEASESALIMIEKWLGDFDLAPRSNVSNAFIPDLASSTDGFVEASPATNPWVWKAMDWKAGSGDFQVYPNLPWGSPTSSILSSNFFAAQPRYIVELAAKNVQCDKKKPKGEGGSYSSPDIPCNALYLTARGVGGTAVAVSMHQSAFNIKVK